MAMILQMRIKERAKKFRNFWEMLIDIQERSPQKKPLPYGVGAW